MLTAEEARLLFSYDPETGDLRWLRPRARRVKVGDMAGHLDSQGYRCVECAGKTYKAHRLVWLIVHGQWPADLIDHINGEKADNRIVNLRRVDKSMNMQNQRKPHANSTVGFLGVSRTHNGRFQARIGHLGRNVSIGVFDTPEEAHAAHLAVKRQLHLGCTI